MLDTLTRPDAACVLHAPPRKVGRWVLADSGYRTCSSCLDQLRDQLREIAARWVALDPRPGAQGENGGRGAPGFGSRPPASDHVIAMRDPRSSRRARAWVGADGRVHRESERPPLSVWGELALMCHHVAEARQVGVPVGDVVFLVRWLDGHLDWCTRQDGVIELGALVRELLAQLKPVTGEPGRRRIGSCPNVLDEGEQTRECGAALYAPLGGSDTIRCRACAREWDRPAWLKLGQLIQLGEAS